MFLLSWWREYKQIKSQYTEDKPCESCETLKMQLSIANDDKARLLDRLLQKPEPEARIDTTELKPIIPRHVPFAVRKQMLEAEDRERARLMRDAPKITVDDLEKELDIASTNRESQSSSKS